MPEKKPKLITFNQSNTELLRNHIKQLKEKLGLNIENIPVQEVIKEEPKIEESKVSVAAEQEPKRFVNSRGRGYNPHFTWGLNGPLTFDDGGNI